MRSQYSLAGQGLTRDAAGCYDKRRKCRDYILQQRKTSGGTRRLKWRRL